MFSILKFKFFELKMLIYLEGSLIVVCYVLLKFLMDDDGKKYTDYVSKFRVF